MSSFKIRPRFKQTFTGHADHFQQQFLAKLNDRDAFLVDSVTNHIYIKILPEEHHFWSPQLHLTFEQDDEKVVVRGLYGPNPTLWAVFFFSYGALGILGLFFGMWGLTRWSLGMTSNVLWALPVFAVIALMLYFSAQAGQKLGAQQMFDIHHCYEEIMQEKVRIS